MDPSPIKVLVIDDERSVCLTCRRILETEGYLVDTTLSGVEGVHLAQEGDYDVVLLDLKMKDMNGMEALEAIKQDRPDVIVIIITGYATIQTSIEAIKKGAFHYVPKPFTPQELSMVVHKAIDDREMRAENRNLKEEISRLSTKFQLLGDTKVMQDVRASIRRIAASDFTVTIYGESGTGKELVARSIHEHSARAQKPFVEVDISTLAPSLAESELFGHVKGAFTGATQTRPGFFTAADGGTLFLDEISNMSIEVQGKLLRILESREVQPVGSERKHPVDVRIVAATNRDLYTLVEEGKFRDDLYYRLNVIPFSVPPLREHSDDVPLLALHFLKQAQEASPTVVQGFTTETMAKLISHGWPGNVRELKNLVARLVATCDRPYVTLEHLPPEIREKAPASADMADLPVPTTAAELKEAKRLLKDQVLSRLEKRFVQNALDRAGGNVSRAAEMVGLLRPNLHALMRKYGVRAKDASGDGPEPPDDGGDLEVSDDDTDL
ncbi:MAG: sigma-54 dependent transcriptional regulator [Polyangia bacterium]|jgi:two-component system NtrC family response regulator|nr:sigma-54 dependent transcriptional regulator [Polyangia bacterium]